MADIGRINKLTVTRIAEFGVFLDAGDYGSVLLANRWLPDEEVQIGDELDVFIYFDSDNQVVATTQNPIAQVGEWGLMKVEGVNSTGAFVNWGIKSKDLLIPFSEQRGRLSVGQTRLVYVYTDKASGRIVGTTKFNKWLDKTPARYTCNQQVDILVAEKSELGFKVIINESHWGMLFPSDVFGKVFVGKKLRGYIKQIRDDGKIDVSLQKIGVAKFDDLGEKILHKLERNNGYLPLGDKSSPEDIFAEFRTSKGTFKKAIGTLYKSGKIKIEPDGIHLVS
ncbi:CvfB family protein [Vibrio salinus]|uniref:CvfB family protein n=1 Tax=Vibrio salinus TaxID=2899784 RepID=UPI001E5CA98A|nr:S1-like domain-containing RNA-binding protein [Vibrio salinus]MCE0492566.1 S1-like domain-containing RNA-binding protein [Vibrio salinus]